MVHSTGPPPAAPAGWSSDRRVAPDHDVVDEATGTLYIPVATDHKNQNEKLMPFIEKKVKVTGSLVEKGGVKGFAIKTIEAAK